MSIDPRIIKTLLQLQLAPSLDLNAASRNPLLEADGDGPASLFDTLLSQYMSDSSPENGPAAPSLPSDALAQLSSLNSLTNISYNSQDKPSSSPSEYDELIRQAAAKYGVDPSLVKAVVKTESGFRADAESGAGAKGLMQLMDGTARGLGVTDSFDPVQNIEGGTKYLSLLLKKYNGNEQVALAAYNAGPGRVDRTGIRTDEQLIENLEALPEETQRYVAKVLQAR